AGTGQIAHIIYEVQALDLIRKGAPLGTATLEKPEIARRLFLSAANGPHPNAARLLVHFMMSPEGLRPYCAVDVTNKSIMDRDGTKAGCRPLAADVSFLPTEVPSNEDKAAIRAALRLK